MDRDPIKSHMVAVEVPQGLSHLAHRRWIGYLGFILPILLIWLGVVRNDPSAPLDHPLGSVSSYYHTGAVAAFVGVLFALSGFLFTYRGYSDSRADQLLGMFGGLCALGVAFFPAEAPAGVEPPGWWSPRAGAIHYVSAALLFATFIAFSIWLFRKTNVPEGQDLPPDKKWRNRLFLACGIVMIVAIVWAGLAGMGGRSIFWQEVAALWAFALSWLVKGESMPTEFVRVRLERRRAARTGP